MSEEKSIEEISPEDQPAPENAMTPIDNSDSLPALQGNLVEPADLPAVAAGLVHEVKNPLAAIHLHLQLLEGYVDEIKTAGLKDKIQDKVHFIKGEIQSLNDSLQDFIRLIRSETKAMLMDVDFNALIGDIVEFLEPQALREGIDIQFHPGMTDESIRMDAAFVKQIVMNLIINSIQAFEKSDTPFEGRNIDIHTGREGPFTFVRVRDNGPGIPDEIRSRIFDSFYSTKEKGSGLGLSLVKRMIGAMGGHLELHTEPGKGTEFTVLLGGPEMIARDSN